MNHPKILKRVEKLLVDKYGPQTDTGLLAQLMVSRWDDMPQDTWKRQLINNGWSRREADRLHFVIEKSAL